MIYEASLYYDKVNVREKPRKEQVSQWQTFPTEEEAKAFVIQRARLKLVKAKDDLKRAKQRLAKAVRRFGKPCEHGVDDPEECGLCDDHKRSDHPRERL